MEQRELFAETMKCLGLSQSDIAKQIDVSRSAVSNYLKLGTSLSKDKLRDIARILNINPDYVESQNVYPFGGQEARLIKVIIPENFITMHLDYKLIHYLTELNSDLEILFLSPRIPEEYLTNPYDIPIYAIAVKDEANNIFLFRRKIKSMIWAVIVGSRELELEVTQIAQREQKVVTFRVKRIERDLYEKIKSWSGLHLDELAHLFEESPVDLQDLNEEERRLIKIIRENQLKISVITAFAQTLAQAEDNQ